MNEQERIDKLAASGEAHQATEPVRKALADAYEVYITAQAAVETLEDELNRVWRETYDRVLEERQRRQGRE